MNSVTLLGNLTKVPQIREVGASKTPVCNFTLAVNDEYIKNGEKVKNTTYVECESWSWLATLMDGLTTKDKVVVAGSLKSQVKEEGSKPTLLVKATSISVVPYTGNNKKTSSTPAPVSEELEVVGSSAGNDIPF